MEEPSDKPSKNRRSFTGEFKLGVIKHYRKHGQSIHHTSDKYKIDRKQVRNGLKNEETIFGQKKRTKAIRRGKVRFPDLEQKLYDEFIQKRNEGRIIKKWWFMPRAKQIVRSDYDARLFQSFIKHRFSFITFCACANFANIKLSANALWQSPLKPYDFK